ncbi:MAG: glycosyltransferase [Butyrivibrio sp.]|nr:glycosyltransferase [Butyrivibrio sp.]
MKNELISIVVPVYNVEKYLDKCIESLENQTYGNLEIILVDDGATDNSGGICDLHAQADKRIHVLHQKNGGRAAARNVGMDRAAGEYLMFVDGDDWIDTDCIEEAYKFIETDTEMVVFRERSIYTDRVEGNGTDRHAKFVGSEPLEFYINGYRDFQTVTAVWGKLYRRNLLQGIRFEEGRYYEDIMFITKVYAACHNCIYLDKAYYNYNVATDNSITAKGAIEVTFRDEIPLFHEKEVFLNNMGREDLSIRFSYLKHQRLIRYYTECVQAKKHEYVKRLIKIIREDEELIRKMIKMEYVSRYYRTYLRIFLVSPKMAYIFGNLFEEFVKLRDIVRSLGKSGGQ